MNEEQPNQAFDTARSHINKELVQIEESVKKATQDWPIISIPIASVFLTMTCTVKTAPYWAIVVLFSTSFITILSLVIAIIYRRCVYKKYRDELCNAPLQASTQKKEYYKTDIHKFYNKTDEIKNKYEKLPYIMWWVSIISFLISLIFSLIIFI